MTTEMKRGLVLNQWLIGKANGIIYTNSQTSIDILASSPKTVFAKLIAY